MIDIFLIFVWLLSHLYVFCPESSKKPGKIYNNRTLFANDTILLYLIHAENAVPAKTYFLYWCKSPK